MDVGRDLGLLHGVFSVLPRGVAELTPLLSPRFNAGLRPPFSLGMSSDIRPFVHRLSSGMARRSAAAAGEGWRGVVGAGDLFALSMFSKWLRREDTGFCSPVRLLSPMERPTHDGRAIGALVGGTLHGESLLVNRHRGLLYRYSSTAERPFPLSAGGIL